MLGMFSRQAVLASLLAGVVVAAPPEAPRQVNQEVNEANREINREVNEANREINRAREGARPRQPAPTVDQRGSVQIQAGQPGQPVVQPGQVQQVRPVQPGVVVDGRRDVVRDGTQNDARDLDQHIADCLILGNQEEINMGQFALDRANDPRVKEFAQMLIRDHSELNQKLQAFASNRQQAQIEGAAPAVVQAGRTLPTATPADRREARQELRQQGESAREAREAVRDAAQAGNNLATGQRIEVTAGYRGQGNALNDRLFQIAQDAKRNCEEMTKEELSKESGAAFDKAFLGCQVGAHIGMLAELKAAQPHVSPELQQVLAEATQSTKQHKAHAEKLMKDIKHDAKDAN